jgi:hypothetical protein
MASFFCPDLLENDEEWTGEITVATTTAKNLGPVSGFMPGAWHYEPQNALFL